MAAAMLVILVRPRLRARARQDMAAEMHAVQTLGSTVFCFLGRDGVVASITPNARQVLGEACDRAADLSLTFAELIQPDDRPAVEGWIARAWMTEPPPPCVVPTRAPSSGRRWLQLSTPGRVVAGRHDSILIEIRDVTDQAERDNHARLLARALDAGTDAAYITDLDGRLEYVNSAFERMYGYRSAEVLGRPTSLLSSGRHRPDVFSVMWKTIAAGEPYNGELVNRRSDGSLCTVDLTITRLPGNDTIAPCYVALARDITSRKRIEHDVEELAFYDALTGLANHRLLRERARQILALVRRHGSTAGLLHVDLGGLGNINHQHGRAIGDDVLRSVADRLKQGLRESDTLARLGDDEFLVLLGEAGDEQSIARVVRRLHESITQPFALHGRTLSITARIGVALYPHDATSFDDLVAAADVALRRAEHAATAFEFFEHSVSAASHDRLLLEDDLHWAWEHDHFVLHYQPIIGAAAGIADSDGNAVEIASDDVIGREALARWPHMERGLLEPSQFIPIAERTGRILSLDRWAITTAVRQAVRWNETGWRGWVSVRLSTRSLQDPELAAYIGRTLHSNGLDGSRLVIEFTESAAMRDRAQTARGLEALRSLGVFTALGDFGEGDSSLTCLKLFPVDFLKLGRSVIDAVGKDTREEHLIESLISLAHGIGAKVIADGVGQVGQMNWLRQRGCDFVQGRLVGMPAPSEPVPPAPPA